MGTPSINEIVVSFRKIRAVMVSLHECSNALTKKPVLCWHLSTNKNMNNANKMIGIFKGKNAIQ